MEQVVNKTEYKGAPTIGGTAIDKTLGIALSSINPILGGAYKLLSGGFKAIQDMVQKNKFEKMGGVSHIETDASDFNIYGGRVRGEGTNFDQTEVVTTYEDVSNKSGIASDIAMFGGDMFRASLGQGGIMGSVKDAIDIGGGVVDDVGGFMGDIFKREDGGLNKENRDFSIRGNAGFPYINKSIHDLWNEEQNAGPLQTVNNFTPLSNQAREDVKEQGLFQTSPVVQQEENNKNSGVPFSVEQSAKDVRFDGNNSLTNDFIKSTKPSDNNDFSLSIFNPYKF